MNHSIEINDVENYEFRHEVAGSYGVHIHKSLVAVVKGCHVHYEVSDHNVPIHKTAIMQEAVDAYNKLQRK